MLFNLVSVIIGSSALSAVVSGVFNIIANHKSKNQDIMLLLYHDIKAECREYIAAGEIDSDSLEILTKMHERYHKRGGNGYLDKLMNIVMSLPIVG